MSRIGRKPIPVPAGVEIQIEPELVTVKGPKGELSERIPRDITVVLEGEELLVTRPTDRGEHRSLHGLTRSLVANMVGGVSKGFEKKLALVGVGFRAQAQGHEPERIAVRHLDADLGTELAPERQDGLDRIDDHDRGQAAAGDGVHDGLLWQIDRPGAGHVLKTTPPARSPIQPNVSVRCRL